MSRIGKAPIQLPAGVSIEERERVVHVKGKKGALTAPLPPRISMQVADGQVRMQRPNDSRSTRALHGLARALVANMVRGVTEGFHKDLEIEGVGYRAEVQGRKLNLSLGFSHPVAMEVPEGLQVSVEGNTKIRIEGIDKQKVGQFAADVRALRPPEPYKGKGVRYAGERIRRKVGKAGVA